MQRVLVVPGLGVRRYAVPAAEEVRRRGVEVHLLPAPGSPGRPADLCRYGELLARELADARVADLLVGLSVGAQGAVVAALGAGAAVRHLVLVSPTVDPQLRTAGRLLRRWAAAGRLESPRLLREQAPDWWQAGARRVTAVLRSALEVRIEDLVDDVSARLTVVHAERDAVTSHAYAARLAIDHGGTLVVVPGATHSWPYADERRFGDLVERLLRE